MTKKIISWLSFMAVFFFLLHSCVHDEIYSSSDPASREYHSKSVFKEDEKYIKNVMDIYFENEEAIKKTTGTPLWDYAMTMGTMDESFLIVPVADGKTVITCLQVPRNGNYVRFLYDNDREHIKFFQNYLLSEKREPVKQEPYSSPTGKGLAECKVTAVSMWYPADEYGSNAGYWETNYIITCPPEQTDGDGNESGPGDTTYPYPGGGGNPNPQNPKTPCAKVKNIVSNSQLKTKIDSLKQYSLTAVANEKGYQQDKAGNITPAPVNGAHHVDFIIGTNSLGGIHCHTLNGTHMFSPKDILTLLSFAGVQNQTLPIGSTLDNTGNAYLGMIAQSGSYFITFNGGSGDLPPPMTDAEEDAYRIKLNKEYNKIIVKLLKAEGKINLIKENNGNTSTIQQNPDETIKAPIPC